MIYKTLKKLKKFKKAVDRKKIRWYYIRALAVTKLSVKYTRSSGVVVNMPPCHGGDRGFKSRPDRHYRRCSSMVERNLAMVDTRVRFPSPAPLR